MPTLEQLVAQDPGPTEGYPTQINYGTGEWRVVFQIADPQQGDNVEWHDLTGPVQQVRWKHGTSQVRGRAQPVQPTVVIANRAGDDRYAPWNADNSAQFGGTHVPLQGGLLGRLVLFRVNGGSVDLSFPQWTARVWRWGDQSTAYGQHRIHRVQFVSLTSTLNGEWLAPRPAEGWRTRLDAVLASWEFGVDVFGAELADGVSTLRLLERPQQDSALTELDVTLDPAGLAWRVQPNGRLLVYPLPWDTWHLSLFNSGATITGSQRVNPLLSYYPSGITFDHTPSGDEVGFPPESDGTSFGIGSDYQQVANQQLVRHPLDVDAPEGGFGLSGYDNVTSASRFGRRPLPSATWIAQNDAVLRANVNDRAFAHEVAEPLNFDVDRPSAFPAIAILDHFDPIAVHHKSRPTGTEITRVGLVRSIEHTLTPLTDNVIDWRATLQMDLNASDEALALETPTGLTLDTVGPTSVSMSWTDPGGHAATPTNVQVRILGSSSQWVPIGYPATSHTWTGLRPSSWYEFEVRFVTRVDNIVTHYSEAARLAFYTDEQPRTDIDGDEGTVPDESLDPMCTTLWRLEQSFDGNTWILLDSGDDADFFDDAGTTKLDLSSYSFVDGVYYRLGTKLVCDDEAGEWHYNLPYRRNGAQLETVLVELVTLGTNVAIGTNVGTEFRVPWPCKLLDVVLSVSGDQSTAGAITADINLQGGSSIMSTPVSIDANEADSTTAATPYVLSTDEFVAGDVLEFDLDSAGTDATGPVLLTLLLERVIGT